MTHDRLKSNWYILYGCKKNLYHDGVPYIIKSFNNNDRVSYLEERTVYEEIVDHIFELIISNKSINIMGYFWESSKKKS